jgi:prepilin-type N-terminal cleavage/methylation domain-containing protein
MRKNVKAPQSGRNRGLTLIELLVAMVISAILIGAVYRTFINQQNTYVVQEQVVDMQQNVRVAINRMMREIRMAGFGNVASILPFEAPDGGKTVIFDNIINPIDNKNNVEQNDDQVTIIGAFEQVSSLEEPAEGTNVIKLVEKGSDFNTGYRRFLCVGGLEARTVTGLNGNTITLSERLKLRYEAGTPVYKVKAITYQLDWDNRNPNMPVLKREDKTDEGGSQAVAENIENLQFEYFGKDKNGDGIPDPAISAGDIRLIKVTVVARTSLSDPEYKGETGGFRRRTITSNILVRNMGLIP